jgi:hypothetical protein
VLHTYFDQSLKDAVMLRNSFIIFLLGWITWFWIDKPPPAQQNLPPVADSMIDNFQIAFNILKSGYPEVSFVYIWNAHYLLLSLLGGALLTVAIGTASELLSRRRRRLHIMPPAAVTRRVDSKHTPTEQSSVSTDKPSSSGLPPVD